MSGRRGSGEESDGVPGDLALDSAGSRAGRPPGAGTTGERVVRVLLRLYPADFRAARGEELVDLVRQERAQLGASATRRALTGFWLGTMSDVLRSAVRLRIMRAPERDHESDGSLRALPLRGMLRELRPALRRLRTTPAFTLIVVLSLALGIGLSGATYSIVDAVLVEPLSYREPSRLMHIEARWDENGMENVRLSGGEVTRIREAATSYEAIAAVGSIRQNLTGGELPQQVQVGWVTHNLFGVLGVEAALGRTFTPGDPPGTALLDYDLWLRSFGGDPGVLGSTVRLDGYPYVVAGVLPRGFRLHLRGFNERQDVWKVPDDWWQNGDVWSATGAAFGSFRLIGRLRPGVTLQQANAEADRLGREIARTVDGYQSVGYRLVVSGLRARVVRDVRATLLLLQGAVLLVLLIACANVFNLMLVRTQGRAHEIALRRALGSGRAGIVRLVLAEGVLLGCAAGLAGVLVAYAGVRGLAWLRPPQLPRIEHIALDLRVIAFSAVLTLLCTAAFSLLPALALTRRWPVGRMMTARVTADRARGRATRVLVVAQLAVSVVLLIGAGLLVRSMASLNRVDPGFRAEDLLAFSVTLPGKRYERPHGTDRFLRELEQRLEALPGVHAAGVVWPLPLNGRVWSDDYIAGVVRDDARSMAEYRLATEGYFEAMGVRLIDGRLFRASDVRAVAVVSRSLAARAWPGASAVGRRIRATPWGGAMVDMEVIGVVEDVRNADLREAPGQTIYFDSRGWSWTDWEVDVVVRTSDAPTAIVPAVRRLLLDMDAEVPLAGARTMTEYVGDNLAPNRFALGLVSIFAAVAALLALVGLYGVVSYWAGSRMRELGIRLALGSARRSVFSLVLSQGLRLTACGLVVGLFGAAALTRLLGSLLHGVQATDAATFAAVGVAVAAVALVASVLPARRATRVDPLTVLRAE